MSCAKTTTTPEVHGRGESSNLANSAGYTRDANAQNLASSAGCARNADIQTLIKDIKAFIPFNEQEQRDKEIFLSHLSSGTDIFTRDEQAHVTCSIWTLNTQKTKTLMVYHNIYDSWSWIGGHADGCADLKRVALKELFEETGVRCSSVCETPNPESESPILSLEVLTVDGHEKNDAYVSSHLHLNVTYLAFADEDIKLCENEKENSGVSWVALERVCQASTEPWIATRIYQKLLDKGHAYGW
ncbi:MAG: NUDIX hydrolase [Anaerotardibacter sp.]